MGSDLSIGKPPARLVRALVGLALACLVQWLVAGVCVAQPVPVTVLRVHDAIGPASADYLLRGIEQAHSRGSGLVVVELDTPGGLDSSMRQIIQAILSSPVPVAVYVSPEGARAASAGTYILYASHVAAMAPATTLGAATPVAIGLPGADRKPAQGEPDGRPPPPKDAGSKDGSQPDGAPKEGARPSMPPADAMSAKQVHDAAAFIRGLAQQRGRNAAWAERAVREAVSLTATEALRDGVVDVVARSLPDLLEQIDGRVVRVPSGDVTLKTRGSRHELVLPDWRHRLLSVIANPSFALILLMIGIYGLIFEFSTPGFGVGGIAGAICLLLALFALQLLPVNYAGLALILLGVALLVAEAFTPSFGVLGIGGVIAFAAGAILLFDRDVPGFAPSLALILGLAAGATVATLLAGSMALRSRRRPVVSGREEMIGAPGEVLQVGDGEAWVLVHGERWKAEGAAALAPGRRVRVQAVRGLVLEVRPDAESNPSGDAR